MADEATFLLSSYQAGMKLYAGTYLFLFFPEVFSHSGVITACLGTADQIVANANTPMESVRYS